MDVSSLITNSIQILILAFAIAVSFRSLKIKGGSVVIFYFTFGMICMLLADFYWIACGLIDSEIMDPYNINEIGEMGSALLFASVLNVVFKNKKAEVGLSIFLTILFTIAVTVLWIFWSDELVKNIIGGVYFGYFMCVIVASVKKTGALKKAEEIILWITVFVILILEYMVIYLPETVSLILDIICYIIIYGLLAYLVLRAVLQFRLAYKDKSIEVSEIALTLSFFAYLWSQNAMFMSYEPLYTIAGMTGIFMILLSLFAVLLVEKKKESGKEERV